MSAGDCLMSESKRSFTALLALLVVLTAPAQAQMQMTSPTYSRDQSVAGQAIYDQQCAHCHGTSLNNGEFGPPLSGEEFPQKWGNQSAAAVFDSIVRTMPQAEPGSLSPRQGRELLAYILAKNAVAPSDTPLPSEFAALERMIMPTPANGLLGGLVNGIPLMPAPHPTPNPLDKITPVTEAMLQSPRDDDWLTWRRTPNDGGFSRSSRSTTAMWIGSRLPGPGHCRTDRTSRPHSFMTV